MIRRRELLKLGGVLSLGGLTSKAAQGFRATSATETGNLCLAKQNELTTESSDSPFFLHFHQLSIPDIALLKPPVDGIIVQTSPIDPGSYDVEGFRKFIEATGLDAKKMASHSHAVMITSRQLSRIAGGETEVEIRVTSANGNYVHNFLVSATPSTLAKVRRFREGKLKI